MAVSRDSMALGAKFRFGSEAEIGGTIGLSSAFGQERTFLLTSVTLLLLQIRLSSHLEFFPTFE